MMMMNISFDKSTNQNASNNKRRRKLIKLVYSALVLVIFTFILLFCMFSKGIFIF